MVKTDDNLITSPPDGTPQQPVRTLRQRGRKSAASLCVVAAHDGELEPPAPPATLSPAEAAIWRDVTSKVRPTWFLSSELILETYCRVMVQHRQLADALRQEPVASERYLTIARLQHSVTVLASNLATRLRLTPRSSVSRVAPKLASSQGRPWDDADPAA
jgi:hypothetical protein